MVIKEGVEAPDFTLLDETETQHKLSDYRGKPVVLYFYPRDDTPGCTVEACSFRDDYPEYGKAGVVILGVGNVLFGDDGFGPAVVEALERRYQIPGDVYLMDVGTGVRKLLFTLTLSAARPADLVIVDAVDWGRQVGQVFNLPVEELPVSKIDDFSLHQVPTSNLLRELQDACGVRVTVVACDVGEIPQRIQPGLSAPISQAVQVAGLGLPRQFCFTPS